MNTLEISQPLVSVSWLAEHINHPDLILLDATIPKVTSKKDSDTITTIKNARFFDIKKTFSDTTTDIPNTLPSPEDFSVSCQELGISSNSTIIIYDRLGIYSSPRVWWMFMTMGHKNVAVLDGGLPEWDNLGYPLEKTYAQQWDKGDFTATYNPLLNSNAAVVLDKINSENTLILDARSPGRFEAKEPEPRASLKGGHIPNSMNLYYATVLQNGKMLPTNELKELLKNFNIEHKKLIFTCGSGITACIIMLAATLAGYKNMSVYDGSWSEWGQLNNVPIQC